MLLARLQPVIAAVLLAGCAAQSSIKPAEVLDERTGMTVGSLHQPIELMQDTQRTAGSVKRASFAYLGPVEWDNMGNVSYGLWVHLAPGAEGHFADIHSPGAVSLVLDDGAITLVGMEAPALAHAPYRPVASWGQTGYFRFDVPTLQRMASSQNIELDFRTPTDASVHFIADRDARETLARYLHSRGY
jgi:hypothetical protein